MNHITLEKQEAINLLEKTIKEYVAVEKSGISFTKVKKSLIPMITERFNKNLNHHYSGNYLSFMIELFACKLGNENDSFCFYDYVNKLIDKYNFEIDTLDIKGEEKEIGQHLMHDGESLFRKRNGLTTKHAIFLGSVGCGKTEAIKKEIELILKNTDDDIIVIDNDGIYEKFTLKNNGFYVKMSENSTFLDGDVKNQCKRLMVFDITGRSDEKEFALDILKYSKQRKSEKINQSKNTWLYLDEVKELIVDDLFLEVLMSCIKEKIVITISSNRVMDIIKAVNSRLIFSNIPYVRLFKQVPYEIEQISEFFSIEPELLKKCDRETSVGILKSWSIVKNEKTD